jgi:hypothetical protein
MKLKKVSSILNKAVKTKGSYTFPKSALTNEASFFMGLICGSRNAGKTTTAVNIILADKANMLTGDNHVYWVSSSKDPKVVALLDEHDNNVSYYDELTKRNIEDVVAEITDRNHAWKEEHFLFDLMERYLKDEHSISEEEHDVLVDSGLFEEEMDWDERIKQHNFQHPPISTLIVDDSVGSELISGTGRDAKWFLKLLLRHRHDPLHMNVFILTQHYKMVNRAIRANCNNIILFKLLNQEIMETIFSEFSPLFKHNKKYYMQALDLLEKHPHSFLNLWYDKTKFVRLNFDKAIVFDEDDKAVEVHDIQGPVLPPVEK